MKISECIKLRRSIRKYENREIDDTVIRSILETSIWTPSGKNGQPWRFRVIKDKEIIRKLSSHSIYENWMKTANCFIVIFLDKDSSYNYVKDVQSCGAFMQTLMLAAYDEGVGSCWIGEILKEEDEVKKILEISNPEYELMGIVTLGFSADSMAQSQRKKLEDFLV